MVRPRTATTVRMQILLTGPLSGEGPSRSRFDRYARVCLSGDADQPSVQTSDLSCHGTTALSEILMRVQR